jgi:hypothetical protein
MEGGDGGGDGVVDVDRNVGPRGDVGPRGVDAADSEESLKKRGDRSSGCDIGRAICRGLGCAKSGEAALCGGVGDEAVDTGVYCGVP